MLLDTYNPFNLGKKSRFVTPMINSANGQTCALRFFYYMFGSGMGSLSAYVRYSDRSIKSTVTPLVVNGDKGQQWIRGIVSNRDKRPFQFVIEGQLGLTTLSEVAIDDLTMSSGCRLYGSNQTSHTTTSSVTTNKQSSHSTTTTPVQSTSTRHSTKWTPTTVTTKRGHSVSTQSTGKKSTHSTSTHRTSQSKSSSGHSKRTTTETTSLPNIGKDKSGGDHDKSKSISFIDVTRDG